MDWMDLTDEQEFVLRGWFKRNSTFYGIQITSGHPIDYRFNDDYTIESRVSIRSSWGSPVLFDHLHHDSWMLIFKIIWDQVYES